MHAFYQFSARPSPLASSTGRNEARQTSDARATQSTGGGKDLSWRIFADAGRFHPTANEPSASARKSESLFGKHDA
ncbi:hypothetical protein AZF01_17900 [Martelella sp. AD-3]|nr:hypothetical protein AZF01_17900 [Martelella sp. AD-3]